MGLEGLQGLLILDAGGAILGGSFQLFLFHGQVAIELPDHVVGGEDGQQHACHQPDVAAETGQVGHQAHEEDVEGKDPVAPDHGPEAASPEPDEKEDAEGQDG